MSLSEINEKGHKYDVTSLSYERDFDRIWDSLSRGERDAIEAEINARIDRLVQSPDPNWGSITNTSLEGGAVNPHTGIGGDWRDTVFQPIYRACGQNRELAGMFFGNVWKKVIIDRREHWIGIRFDPTFPQKGITLAGKTYFLPDDTSDQ